MFESRLLHKKYPKNYNDSEKILFFILKVTGSVTFLFLVCFGIDVYRVVQKFF